MSNHNVINLAPVTANEIATSNGQSVIDLEAASVNETVTPSLMGWIQRRNDVRLGDFDTLTDYLRNRSSRSRSEIVKSREVEFVPHPNPQTRDDANKLGVRVGDQVLDFTHHAFGQVAQLAKSPAAYLRTLPAMLAADCLDYSMKFVRDVEDVKLYFDNTSLRAATGPNYGRVDDWTIVEALQNVLDSGKWAPALDHMGLSVTDRSLNMFLIDQSNPVEVGGTMRGDPDILHRGLRIVNSEVGFAALKIEGFVFRSYCTNGMIFGRSGDFAMNIRHTSGAPSRWLREAQPVLERYTQADNMQLVDAVRLAKETKVVSDNDDAIAWLNKRKLTMAQARKAVECVQIEEGVNPRTLWDLSQGVTAMARSAVHVDDRAELERIGGQIFKLAA